jgi:CHAT domain-containing protein
LSADPHLDLSQQGVMATGLLDFSDILELRLNADLVVLSACNTHLGALRQGEGIVGLTRAFLYAGASSSVVSLWKVEDQATSIFMEKFYRRLKRGDNKVEALRRAKMEMLKTSVEHKGLGQRVSLASPFFWAAFILVGDWN